MTQLLSVACLSLAVKMEETEIPLPLDLQVKNGSKIEIFFLQKKFVSCLFEQSVSNIDRFPTGW